MNDIAIPNFNRLEECTEAMSNFDGEIDDGMETKLRAGYFSHHAAWEHYGRVWFAGEMFHEQVKRYGCVVAVISADTLSALMKAVNDKFGWS